MEKKAVFPGDVIAVAEEFESGKNTFEDEEGNITSTLTGIALFNEQEKEVSVAKKGHKAIPLDVGSTVLGSVALVKDDVVILHVFDAKKNGERRVIRESNAALGISKVSQEYIRSLNDKFKIGDIVKAEVWEITPYSLEITTNKPELGVIKAFCSGCRQPLYLFQGKLKCLHCGNVETRKLSKDYVLR